MNLYTISDIHGNADTFRELLSSIGFNKEDKLFILGDLLNRGPKSKEVIDTIWKLQADGYSVEVLAGNHEEMLIDSLNYFSRFLPTVELMDSFKISNTNDFPANYRDWIQNLPHFLEMDEYIMVHAGLNFSLEMPLEDSSYCKWIRDWYDSINYKWLRERKIIHGHVTTAKTEILKMRDNLEQKQVICIDNGCNRKGEQGFGNLCAFNITTKDLYFQPNRDR